MVLAESQSLGIQEYWIVDYLGLGGRNFIGYPKQPTISVYYLIDLKVAIAFSRQHFPV